MCPPPKKLGGPACAQVLLLWLGMPLVKQWAAAESDAILGPKKWIIMGTLLGSAACVAQLATCHVVVLHMYYVPNTHTMATWQWSMPHYVVQCLFSVSLAPSAIVIVQVGQQPTHIKLIVVSSLWIQVQKCC